MKEYKVISEFKRDGERVIPSETDTIPLSDSEAERLKKANCVIDIETRVIKPEATRKAPKRRSRNQKDDTESS